MRQDTGSKLPLEVRIEQRSEELGSDIRETASRMQKDGLSERAIAGYLSTVEYINDIMDRTMVGTAWKSDDKERFIVEIQEAVRTLSHGLVMGEGAQRYEEQMNIANGRGKLKKEIAEALRRANGTGKTGGDETVMVYEHEV